jgi:hypothetical protein
MEYTIAALGGSSLPGPDYAAWVGEWVWLPMFSTAMPGLVLFPDGRPPSKRWRPLVWASAMAIALMMAMVGISEDAVGGELALENPFGISAGPEVDGTPVYDWAVWLAGFLILLPLCALSLVLRFRRSTGSERQQIKWLAVAGLVVAIALFPTAWFGESENELVSEISEAGFLVVLMAVPLSMTAAILRYRLYDIDLIVNRTLVYGALTITTVGSYAAMVVAFGWVVRTITGQGSNEIVVAATTLIVAAMFQPVRRRIQGIVDRRFYRARYDASQTLEAFQERLRHQTDFESLRGEIQGVANETMRPAHVSLWLRETGARR